MNFTFILLGEVSYIQPFLELWLVDFFIRRHLSNSFSSSMWINSRQVSFIYTQFGLCGLAHFFSMNKVAYIDHMREFLEVQAHLRRSCSIASGNVSILIYLFSNHSLTKSLLKPIATRFSKETLLTEGKQILCGSNLQISWSYKIIQIVSWLCLLFLLVCNF